MRLSRERDELRNTPREELVNRFSVTHICYFHAIATIEKWCWRHSYSGLPSVSE